MEHNYDLALTLHKAAQFFAQFPELTNVEGQQPQLDTLPGGRVRIHWGLSRSLPEAEVDRLMAKVSGRFGTYWTPVPSDHCWYAKELDAGALHFSVWV